MKKTDTQKEDKFIEHYAMTGNAKESAIACGYKETSATSMGHYLKKKLSTQIQIKQTEKINSISGIAISTLEQLLDSEQDSVKLNTAKLILELGGYSKQNINLNIDSQEQKTDKELTDELDILLKDFRPQDMPKTSKEWAKWNEDNPNPHAEEERLAKLEKKH